MPILRADFDAAVKIEDHSPTKVFDRDYYLGRYGASVGANRDPFAYI